MNVSLNPYEGSLRPLPLLTNCPNGGAAGTLPAAPFATAGAVVAFVSVATATLVVPGAPEVADVVQAAGTDHPPSGTALPRPAATPPMLPPRLAPALAPPLSKADPAA